MKDVLTELSDIIYIIYIPYFHKGGGVKMGYFTVTIWELFSLEPSKMSSEEMGGIFSLSLSEYEAMRFWARIRSLKEGIKATDQIQLTEGIKATDQIQLTEMLMICQDSLYDLPWMFIMDEDGNLITTQGEEFVKLLSEKYSADRVKELKQQLLKSAQTSWKKMLLKLEKMLKIDGEDSEESDGEDSEESMSDGEDSEESESDGEDS